MNFGQNKRLDQIIEVLALSALMANNPNKKVEKRLKEIAFPLEIDLEWFVNVARSTFHMVADLVQQIIADTVMELWLDKWVDLQVDLQRPKHSH